MQLDGKQMTRKIFWEDPYLTTLDATVSSVAENTITLDRTNFFAESGGQESDFGSINGYHVIEARKEGLEIFYTLADVYNLRAGDQVEIEIEPVLPVDQSTVMVGLVFNVVHEGCALE